MRAFRASNVKKKNNQREALSHEFWKKRSESPIDWAKDEHGNFLSILEADEIYIATHFLGEFGFYNDEYPEIKRCFELRLVTNDGRVLLRRSHELYKKHNKYDTMTSKYNDFPNWTQSSQVVYTKADGSNFTSDSVWKGAEISKYILAAQKRKLVSSLRSSAASFGRSCLKYGGATRHPIMYASTNGKSFSIRPKFENAPNTLSQLTDKLCGMLICLANVFIRKSKESSGPF